MKMIDLTIEQAEFLMLLDDGNLILNDKPIRSLPDGLIVKGDLELCRTKIKKLPSGLEVYGRLVASDTAIEKLPDDLRVEGSLILNNTNIKDLPNDFTVNGYFNLTNTPIEKLPRNLRVYGDFDLERTLIKSLPNDLWVKETINLSYSQVEELPNNLTVFGILDLSHTPIKRLPKNLTVYDTLDLSKSQIKSLPDDIVLGGSLILEYTQIEELPANLVIPCNLKLTYTPIRELPENLVVGNTLSLSKTLIEDLPKSLAVGRQIIPNIILSKKYGFDYAVLSFEEEFIKEYVDVKVLENGDCIPNKYIYATDMLFHISCCRKFKNYTIYKGKIATDFMVYDGVNYAFGISLKEALASLMVNTAISEGKLEKYAYLGPERKLTIKELTDFYHTITGASIKDITEYIEKQGNIKEKYSFREVELLTKGQFVSYVFSSFIDDYVWNRRMIE